MSYFAMYSKATGMVSCVFMCDAAAGVTGTPWWDGNTYDLVESDLPIGPRDVYVRLSDLTVQPKTALASFNKTSVAANGTDACTVTGLPNPTQVTISGASVDSLTVTDGTLALTFTVTGVYTVALDAGLLYLPSTIAIVAS